VVSDEEQLRVIKLSRRLKYLTLDNPKTIKGMDYGYATAILHLSPGKHSGYTTCHRFGECIDTCLYHQGRGKMYKVQDARIRKTKDLFERYDTTMCAIHKEIRFLHKQLAAEEAPQLAIRLNGMCDLRWEEMSAIGLENETLMSASPEVQFYDYTKYRYGNRLAWTGRGPINYHLTYSYNGTEADVENCKRVLSAGHNVYVVFNKVNYKTALQRIDSHDTMWGYPMIDGEQNDLRFIDRSPSVICGKEKGYSDIAI